MNFKNKNVLIIGYGSIGKRHYEILNNMSVNVYVFSRKKIKIKNSIRSLKKFLTNISFDYIVIANKTSEHYDTLKKLKNFNYQGTILIEKPIFDNVKKFNENSFKKIIVGFNLRFHPVILELKKRLKKEKILSVNAYAGHYLPKWKPKLDYRFTYSAKKAQGGGVLLDFSHEIDYLNWILGSFTEVMGIGGKFSNLKIDSDDLFHILLRTKKHAIVNLELNYIDKVKRRYIVVNTNLHSYKADLISNSLEIDGKVLKFENYRNYSYEKQHQSMLKKNYSINCSFKEGIKNLKIIKAILLSNKIKKWIKIR